MHSRWPPDAAAGCPFGSTALVSSARLVTDAPWLTARVPPPAVAIVLVYYVALTRAVAGRGRLRVAGATVFSTTLVRSAAAPIRFARFATGGPRGSSGSRSSTSGRASRCCWRRRATRCSSTPAVRLRRKPRHRPSRARAGAVGARRAIARRDARHPRRSRSPRRCASPCWMTSGRERSGRASGAAASCRPGAASKARPRDSRSTSRRAARGMRYGHRRRRVARPPSAEPDWERRRVRNDDSLVLELLYGDVSMLLTGDIGGRRARIAPAPHAGAHPHPQSRPPRQPDIVVVRAARAPCGPRSPSSAPAAATASVIPRRGPATASSRLARRCFGPTCDGQMTIETDGTFASMRTFTEDIPWLTTKNTKTTKGTKTTKRTDRQSDGSSAIVLAQNELPSPLSPEAESVMTQTIGCAIAVHRELGPGFLEADLSAGDVHSSSRHAISRSRPSEPIKVDLSRCRDSWTAPGFDRRRTDRPGNEISRCISIEFIERS